MACNGDTITFYQFLLNSLKFSLKSDDRLIFLLMWCENITVKCDCPLRFNYFVIYKKRGRRVIGIFGSLILSKTLMELIFNPMVNFGEVRRAQLAKSTLVASTLVPMGSFQIV